MQDEIQQYEFKNVIKKCLDMNQKSKLDECISSIVKKEGYISCKISKKTRHADHGNFLGKLYEIDMKGQTTDGYKETSIFVKSMAPEANVLELVSVPSVYKTELFVYSNLINIFNKLQDEGKVPDNERYNTVKFYEESNEEAIIMENMTKKQFKACFRMDIVTLDVAEECIKQLARLHGLSFLLQQKRPDYFANRIKPIKTAFKFGNIWNVFVEKFCKIGLECLDADLRNKIKDKLPNILLKMEEYINDQSIMYSCLCHGDYRPTNIMVKIVDGRVRQVIPVDYQLVHYGCPIIDFFYFIYTATDRKFRRAHMVNLKNLYYNSLDRFLKYFDLSAESVLPRKVFEDLYEEKVDYGLMITVLFGPFLFVSEDETSNVTNKAIEDVQFKLDDRFKDRLKDAVEESIEFGCLE